MASDGMLILRLPRQAALAYRLLPISTICLNLLLRRQEPRHSTLRMAMPHLGSASPTNFFKIQNGEPFFEADLAFSLTWRLRKWAILSNCLTLSGLSTP